MMAHASLVDHGVHLFISMQGKTAHEWGFAHHTGDPKRLSQVL